jgi:hypothetical protein
LVQNELHEIDFFVFIFVERLEHFFVPKNSSFFVESRKLERLKLAHVESARLVEIAEFEALFHQRVIVVEMILQLI